MSAIRRMIAVALVVAAAVVGSAACGTSAGPGRSAGRYGSPPEAQPGDSGAQPGDPGDGPAEAAGGAAAGQGGLEARVARVVDGDTIRARIDRRVERVRLIGIDTPESVKPDTPVQCFALEAAARLRALLPEGTPVRLVGDVEARDRYRRLLAYVYRASDGLFVNLALAREGFAVAFTYPPNVAHAGDFVAAAGQARDAGRGLWSRCPDAGARSRGAIGRSPPRPRRLPSHE